MKSLKGLRIRAEMSQEGLAQSLGVSRKTILRWESGEREPRASEIALLAGVLKCSVADLIEESNPTNPAEVLDSGTC